MTVTDRKYEIVLWGATGFTGQLIAEHLVDHYDETELDWAIAGRNPEKLRAVRDQLAKIDQSAESLDILTGDAFDRSSLDAIAEQTEVLCTTVGPYATYGTNVVEACIEHDTDYCDLAGEPQWIHRMIEKHHEVAREQGTRIVHSCGFDSVPSDIGTLMVQTDAEENFGTPCSNVKAFVSSSSFSLSGGTIASMLRMYEESANNPDIQRVIEDPHSLATPGEQSTIDESGQRGPSYDSDIGQWTAPFVMALINQKLVYRSNAVLGYPWGRNFQYDEVLPTGSGVSGAVGATGMSAGLALTTGVMSVSPLRKLLDRYVLPDPGDGPSRETIEKNSFEVRLRGTGTSPESGEEFTVEGKITAERDPGYGAAAWMLGESAVCLARDETDTPLDGGVLTPASGIGMPLVDRLSEVGMEFTVGESS